MASFFSSSQEDQLLIITNLWNKYKFLAIGLLAACVFSIIYREYSIESFENQQLNSALAYSEFLDVDSDLKEEKGSLVLLNYPNTLYADLVAINLAKLKVLEGDNVLAKKHLQRVLDRTSSSWRKNSNPLGFVAMLRLSRIHLSESNPQLVLALLQDVSDLTSGLFEVKGDAETALGDAGSAKLSYLQASEKTQSQTIKSILSMKIAEL